MNLHQFEIFQQVARCRSFSRAARLMHLTQPAISTQIRNLENYYGITLFNRTGRGVELTASGEIMYKYAKQFIALHLQMERELDELAGNIAQELRIGSTAAIGNYGLPCSLWAFKERYPDIELQLDIDTSLGITEKIEQGDLQIGFLERIIDQPSLSCRAILEDQLVVIAPPRPQWLQRESITLEELARNPLIMREKGSFTRQLLEDEWRAKGIEIDDLNIVAEMASLDAIKSAVASGGGLAVMQLIAARNEKNNGRLAVIPIANPPLNLSYYLVHRDKSTLSPAAQRFLNFISLPEDTFC